MADWNIAPPALTHPNVVAAMRAAPPIEPFDEHAALQRMQRVQFLRSIHARGPVADPALTAEWSAHQQRVAAYSQVKAPKPPAIPAPLSTAVVPQAPRAVVPVVPQTPALAGVSRRAEMLTSLLGARPTPAPPTDKLV
jgi:hypothetical protein